MTPQIGAWVDETGRTIEEPGVTFVVYADLGGGTDDRSTRAAEQLLTLLDQKALIVACIGGTGGFWAKEIHRD